MPGSASSSKRITITRLLCATAFIALSLYFLPYTQGDAWPVAWPIASACVGAAIGVTFRGEDGAMLGAAVTGCLIPALLIMLFAALLAIFAFYMVWTGQIVGPGLFENFDLSRDSKRFLLTNVYLQSVDDESVFVAGDSGTFPQRVSTRYGRVTVSIPAQARVPR